jgi:sortase (surface protein transpeptidase)
MPSAAAATSQKADPVVPSARARTRTVPTRIIIPAIGVDAAITPEGTDSSGALKMPPFTARNLTGWWDGGVAPGQNGPAVIAGHVDSAEAGPLVFWNLRLLKPGDTISVEPAGLTFTVTSVTQVSKSAFPTMKVYGATPSPELRLITCGGTFDYATGHYLSNVIVYARELVRS